VGASGLTTLHEFNAQLSQVLNLFFLKHTFDPTQPSGKVFALINANPSVPQHGAARTVNTVLNRFKETSAGLVAWLSAKVAPRTVRAFDFRKVNAFLVGAVAAEVAAGKAATPIAVLP